MPRLVVQPGGKKPRLFEILKPRITIGRSEKNDLALDDVNVSRLHAIVELTPSGYRIADQNSRNGILVDGRSCESALLQDGASIQMGDSVLRFEDTFVADLMQTTLDDVDRDLPSLGRVAERDLRKISDAYRKLSAHMPSSEDRDAILRKLRKAERRALLFEVMDRAGQAMRTSLTSTDILDSMTRQVFIAMEAERVVVMLWDEEKQCLSPASIQQSPSSGSSHQFVLSQTLLNQVLQSRKGVLIRDAAADPQLSKKESISRSRIRSAICEPLVVDEKLYGLLYADNTLRAKAFDQDDLQVLSVLAQAATIHIEAQRARGEIARQEQVRQAYLRFLPEHLAERLVTSPDAVRLGGARCNLTALFADLRGFTSLAETLPPEEAVELLNEFFTEMAREVFHFSGTLDKFLGDGLLAVFGAPLAADDHALNAVQCALSMQAALQELSEEWVRKGRPSIPMGIGINSGEVIAGNIGSPQRMEYTVIGDVVNVAARFTSKAGAGEILLGESTWRHVKNDVPTDALPPMPLKGKREPLPVYRVIPTSKPATATG